MIVFRFAIAFLAIVMIFFGVIAMLAPTPFGFVFVILGFLLLTIAAPALVRRMRRRWRWLDKLVETMGERSPKDIKEVIEETDPDQQDAMEKEVNAEQGEKSYSSRRECEGSR